MPRHPHGYPEAQDSPAHIAPPLELRQAVEAAQKGAVEDAVAFTLAFPIVERTKPFDDPEHTAREIATHPLGEEPDTLVDLPSVDPESTIERDPYRDREGEQTIQASETEVLQRSLQTIGPIEDPNSPPGRVLLGRSRAIRFRIALIEEWPEDFSQSRPSDELLELAVHPAVIVALDGEPVDEPALVRALCDDIRARFPAITRATLRDAGAAACARVTLLGIERAVDYVRTRFAELPGKQRRAAIAVAAQLATDEQRQSTLLSIERALS